MSAGLKIGLVTVDGVGVRNFIHGRFLRVAEAAGHEVTIFTGVPELALRSHCAVSSHVRIVEMPVYRESQQIRFFRRAAEQAHARWHATAAMMENARHRRVSMRSRSDLLNLAVTGTARCNATENGVRRLERLHHEAALKHPLVPWYRERLHKEAPDILLFTHQRPPQIVPLALAARSLDIQSAAFIFSWDNLSSKGRMPVSFDHFLVWSDLMKSELQQFYPEILPDRIHITGTPQFEPYVYEEYAPDPDVIDGLWLPDDAIVILYSCGDIATTPNDERYLAVLADAQCNGLFGNNVAIVVRPSPAESTARFDDVRREWPRLIWSAPDWVQTRLQHPEPWSQRIPNRRDISLLRGLLDRMVLNVNVASTITIDAALFDKPVINPAFGGTPEYPDIFDDNKYFNFDHYRPIVESGAVDVARSPVELVEAVRSRLLDPRSGNPARQALVARQISRSLHGTSERILNAVVRMTGALSP